MNGAYNSYNSCIANSECNGITDSWDCIDGTCVVNTLGTGNYPDFALCDKNCAVEPPQTWDCIDGTCDENFNGNGVFSSLSFCNDKCAVVTFDCGPNGCYDPETGNGQFATEVQCEEICDGTWGSSFDCSGKDGAQNGFPIGYSGYIQPYTCYEVLDSSGNAVPVISPYANSG